MPQSIIQSKTYAETEAIFALATGTYNNTYAGTEIYVSDKSWHLLCYYDREAKPKSGVLKINNGDTLPNWLTPETLLIDTGSLTGDKSNDTGTPVEIQAPTGYTPRYAHSAGTLTSGVSLFDMDDNIIFNINAPGASGYIPNYTGVIDIPAAYYDTHKLKFAQDLSTDTAQLIIEYTKKPI